MPATVFTGGVVNYEFNPETYADENKILVAEINILSEVDWQASINTWLRTASTPVKDVLTNVQAISFKQSDAGEGGVSSVESTDSEGFTTPMAQAALRGIVHQICTDAEFFVGQGGSNGSSISEQFRIALNTMIEATNIYYGIDASKSNSTNTFDVSLGKVQDDLGGSGITPDDIAITDAATTKLRRLVSAWSFVPIMNRLIAGGNFTNGMMPGGNGITDFRFDLNTNARGESNIIDDDAHLVFPVKILFSDGSVTRIEGGGVLTRIDDRSYTLQNSATLGSPAFVHNDIKAYWDKPCVLFEENKDGDYVKIGKYLYALEDSLLSIRADSSVEFQLNIIFARKRPNVLGAIVDVEAAEAAVDAVEGERGRIAGLSYTSTVAAMWTEAVDYATGLGVSPAELEPAPSGGVDPSPLVTPLTTVVIIINALDEVITSLSGLKASRLQNPNDADAASKLSNALASLKSLSGQVEDKKGDLDDHIVSVKVAIDATSAFSATVRQVGDTVYTPGTIAIELLHSRLDVIENRFRDDVSGRLEVDTVVAKIAINEAISKDTKAHANYTDMITEMISTKNAAELRNGDIWYALDSAADLQSSIGKLDGYLSTFQAQAESAKASLASARDASDELEDRVWEFVETEATAIISRIDALDDPSARLNELSPILDKIVMLNAFGDSSTKPSIKSSMAAVLESTQSTFDHMEQVVKDHTNLVAARDGLSNLLYDGSATKDVSYSVDLKNEHDEQEVALSDLETNILSLTLTVTLKYNYTTVLDDAFYDEKAKTLDALNAVSRIVDFGDLLVDAAEISGVIDNLVKDEFSIVSSDVVVHAQGMAEATKDAGENLRETKEELDVFVDKLQELFEDSVTASLSGAENLRDARKNLADAVSSLEVEDSVRQASEALEAARTAHTALANAKAAGAIAGALQILSLGGASEIAVNVGSLSAAYYDETNSPVEILDATEASDALTEHGTTTLSAIEDVKDILDSGQEEVGDAYITLLNAAGAYGTLLTDARTAYHDATTGVVSYVIGDYDINNLPLAQKLVDNATYLQSNLNDPSQVDRITTAVVDANEAMQLTTTGEGHLSILKYRLEQIPRYHSAPNTIMDNKMKDLRGVLGVFRAVDSEASSKRGAAQTTYDQAVSSIVLNEQAKATVEIVRQAQVKDDPNTRPEAEQILAKRDVMEDVYPGRTSAFIKSSVLRDIVILADEAHALCDPHALLTAYDEDDAGDESVAYAFGLRTASNSLLVKLDDYDTKKTDASDVLRVAREELASLIEYIRSSAVPGDRVALSLNSDQIDMDETTTEFSAIETARNMTSVVERVLDDHIGGFSVKLIKIPSTGSGRVQFGLFEVGSSTKVFRFRIVNGLDGICRLKYSIGTLDFDGTTNLTVGNVIAMVYNSSERSVDLMLDGKVVEGGRHTTIDTSLGYNVVIPKMDTGFTVSDLRYTSMAHVEESKVSGDLIGMSYDVADTIGGGDTFETRASSGNGTTLESILSRTFGPSVAGFEFRVRQFPSPADTSAKLVVGLLAVGGQGSEPRDHYVELSAGDVSGQWDLSYATGTDTPITKATNISEEFTVGLVYNDYDDTLNLVLDGVVLNRRTGFNAVLEYRVVATQLPPGFIMSDLRYLSWEAMLARTVPAFAPHNSDTTLVISTANLPNLPSVTVSAIRTIYLDNTQSTVSRAFEVTLVNGEDTNPLGDLEGVSLRYDNQEGGYVLQYDPTAQISTHLLDKTRDYRVHVRNRSPGGMSITSGITSIYHAPVSLRFDDTSPVRIDEGGTIITPKTIHIDRVLSNDLVVNIDVQTGTNGYLIARTATIPSGYTSVVLAVPNTFTYVPPVDPAIPHALEWISGTIKIIVSTPQYKVVEDSGGFDLEFVIPAVPKFEDSAGLDELISIDTSAPPENPIKSFELVNYAYAVEAYFDISVVGGDLNEFSLEESYGITLQREGSSIDIFYDGESLGVVGGEVRFALKVTNRISGEDAISGMMTMRNSPTLQFDGAAAAFVDIIGSSTKVVKLSLSEAFVEAVVVPLVVTEAPAGVMTVNASVTIPPGSTGADVHITANSHPAEHAIVTTLEDTAYSENTPFNITSTTGGDPRYIQVAHDANSIKGTGSGDNGRIPWVDSSVTGDVVLTDRCTFAMWIYIPLISSRSYVLTKSRADKNVRDQVFSIYVGGKIVIWSKSRAVANIPLGGLDTSVGWFYLVIAVDGTSVDAYYTTRASLLSGDDTLHQSGSYVMGTTLAEEVGNGGDTSIGFGGRDGTGWRSMEVQLMDVRIYTDVALSVAQITSARNDSYSRYGDIITERLFAGALASSLGTPFLDTAAANASPNVWETLHSPGGRTFYMMDQDGLPIVVRELERGKTFDETLVDMYTLIDTTYPAQSDMNPVLFSSSIRNITAKPDNVFFKWEHPTETITGDMYALSSDGLSYYARQRNLCTTPSSTWPDGSSGNRKAYVFGRARSPPPIVGMVSIGTPAQPSIILGSRSKMVVRIQHSGYLTAAPHVITYSQ